MVLKVYSDVVLKKVQTVLCCSLTMDGGPKETKTSTQVILWFGRLNRFQMLTKRFKSLTRDGGLNFV